MRAEAAFEFRTVTFGCFACKKGDSIGEGSGCLPDDGLMHYIKKRNIRILGCAVIPLLLIFLCSLQASAFDASSLLLRMYDSLPEEAREELPEQVIRELEAGEEGDVTEIALALNKNYLAQLLVRQLERIYRPVVGAFSTLLGIVVIASVLSVTKDSFSGKTAQSLHFIVTMAMALALYHTLSGVWDTVSQALTSVTVFMRAMAPVMTAIYMAGGNISTAASGQGMLFAFLELIEALGTETLYPMLRICFGMSLLSHAGLSVSLSGVLNAVNRIFSILLVFLVMLLGTVLAYQNTIMQSADTVLARTVRFAVNSFVPLIGGTAGETVRSVIGSISYLKSTVGSVAAVTVIVLSVKPFLSLLLYKCSLWLSSGAAKAMNCLPEAEFISDIGGLFDLAGALLLACTLTMLFTLTLFIRAGVAAV